MNVGAELARAREGRGLSLDDVSGKTKVSVERLSAIEQNDIEQLPPVLYVRGFVKSYASEVGLDPDEVADRYMAQFEQPPTLGEEPSPFLPEQPSTLVEPEPEPLVEHEADQEAPVVAATGLAAAPWTRARFEPETLGSQIKAHSDPNAHPEPKPHTEPMDQIRESNDDEREAPPSVPRAATKSRSPLALLIVGALIAVMAGYFVADRFNILADVDSNPPRETPQSVADGSDRANPSGAVERAPAAGPGAPVDPPVVADRRDAASIDDVSGEWTLTTRVESASYTPFKGLRLGYRLQLEQQGNRVTGSGHKWTENDRPIAQASRTPITVEGTLDGRRLELTFTETGTRRTSGGTLVLDVADEKTLRGSFSSDAAKSRGDAQATRTVPPQ